MFEAEVAAETSSTTVACRKARIGDVPVMHRLVNEHAEAGVMLGRPLSELYENLRDFWVIDDEDGVVIACCSLHINWADLAEVRSLAVDKRYQRRGLGSRLVAACLEDAQRMGLGRVYALTREATFFESVGFTRIGVNELPRKVWGECIRCPKFPECDEVAVVRDL
ncbi:MAG TPA: N-acetyltransferase [Chloroflexota bacterium]|nr:N-acetyltransferase [Chloroflexota bacterium]